MTHADRPHCAVCGAAGQPLYADLPDVTFGSAATGSLSRCGNARCGTVWADPFPDGPTIAGFYATYYTHAAAGAAATPGGAAVSSRAAGRGRALARRCLRRLSGGSARFSPELRYLGALPPGRLLDVGCGNGRFLAEAAQRGWTVFGQEFDGAAAEVARRVSGAEVRVGDLVAAGYAAGDFDAITLGNVLEHLSNPREILAEALRLLKPSGLLVSISPNPNSYLHRRFGPHWRGLEVPRHVYLLPPAATKALCLDVGYSEVEAFSTPGAFGSMETASARIRAAQAPSLSSLPPTSRSRLLAIHAATMLGWDLGEWTVVMARR